VTLPQLESVESYRDITAFGSTFTNEPMAVHQRLSTKEPQRITDAEMLRAKRMRRWYLCVYILGIALMIAAYFAMDWYFRFRLFS